MTGAVMLGAYWSLEARLEEAFFSQSKIAWCLAELSLPLWDRRRCSIHVSWKLVDRQNHGKINHPSDIRIFYYREMGFP